MTGISSLKYAVEKPDDLLAIYTYRYYVNKLEFPLLSVDLFALSYFTLHKHFKQYRLACLAFDFSPFIYITWTISKVAGSAFY